MSVRRICQGCLVAGLMALGTGWGLDKAWGMQPGPPPAPRAEEGMQVLTRGPVHEAFAETVTFDPEAGLVVPNRPPAAIEELPPDQRLEGANVAWIPGYWAWDDERSDFLWVSGIWRNLPPGRQWVPGYWGKSESGFQWTSGYWADANAGEVEYLPEPPATVEAGPNRAAPSADQTWLPGSWVWQQNRYAWRPGFWAKVQPDWVWTPAHYVYTPRGYVFVDGYWDYSVARRGVLFAPVYFAGGTYTRPGFSYSPTTVIDLGAFVDNLFFRPRYQHYYFGDYYAANYHNAGYYPSHSVNTSRYGYDPIFAHERWRHRQDGEWEQRVAATYENRRDHIEARPPRTWANQNVSGSGLEAAVRNIVGASLDQASRNRSGAWRFQPIDQAERQRLSQHGQEIQRFRDQRQEWENKAAVAPATGPVHRGEPTRMKLPPSPIAAKSADHLGRDYTPPRTYAVPPFDKVVQPQPRVNRSPEQPRPRSTLRVPLDTPQPKPQPKMDRPAESRVEGRESRAPAESKTEGRESRSPVKSRGEGRESRAPAESRAEGRESRAPQESQPRVDRPAPQPRGDKPAGSPATGSKPEEQKGKSKGKHEGKSKG